MFTGIIKHTSRFKGYLLGKSVLRVEAASIAPQLEPGSSLAVNGVCLSLIKREKTLLHFNLSEETLKKSSLGLLGYGDRLNLELPLTLASPLDGHMVTGHIDGMGKILEVKSKKTGKRFRVAFPADLKLFFIRKGSVALDGVSLTIAELHNDSMEVEIIPITLKNTNLQDWRRGRQVNIECDIIGKYVYNWTYKSD